MSIDELRRLLQPFGQEHLVAFWNELSPGSRCQLESQIAGLDFAQLAALARGHDQAPDWADLARRARPPRAIRLQAENEFSAAEAMTCGEEALRAGRFGLILVAGGQGTRLGFHEPKGMFPLGPVSRRTLFQILIERTRAVARRFGTRIPLYLMTSPATDTDTRAFFAKHERFGLRPDDLHIFCQGVMPAVEPETGRVLLAAKDSLALSPDGHGGTLRAFVQSGCLADAATRGIDQLFYCQVDNPLAQIGDPLLTGYHLLAKSDMTTQVVQKRFATERVGNVVDIDGRTHIIEYSDLPDPYAEQRQPDGSLLLWAGSLAIHVFRREFLEDAAAQADALPFHRALKQVDHIDAHGRLVTPQAPQAIKFERFIFDLLPLAKNAIVVEADPAEAFAPVKNADGAPTDSPATAKAAMIARDTKLLQAAGAAVAPGVAVEVSPLWALDAAEAAARIPRGLRITTPTYFSPAEAGSPSPVRT